MNPSWPHLKKQLNEALVSAFNQARFEMMLRLECEKDLNHLVPSGSTYPHKVFVVIEDAESNGWLDCLARGARKENPGNDPLQEVSAAILAGIEVEGRNFYQTAVDVQSKLLGAELLVKLNKIDLPGIDLREARRVARSASNAIREGKLGYALIAASVPRESDKI